MRRLPVYLLLDTSGSMYGEPIEAVKNGVQTLISTLRGDPYALETAYISIITFNSVAQQVTPLTELSAFQQPQIEASGCTALGEALTLLAQKVDTEIVKSYYAYTNSFQRIRVLTESCNHIRQANLDTFYRFTLHRPAGINQNIYR